jgi:hypothetical protein
MEVSGQLHVPAAFPHDTHYIRGWVCTTAGLDAVAKRKIPFPAPAENGTSVVQPVV